ncbi:hypothetical protein [Aquabacterium sp.]|uniref:hypothetical protein n=1 Tax=Aquabacterium sp. TaxID=1872578 RepID=UPI002C327BDD|nr:hypothetical protein [Aquabacterium sp.]HSW08428.1 hypothetical protein [Aquabacterium sp.]
MTIRTSKTLLKDFVGHLSPWGYGQVAAALACRLVMLLVVMALGACASLPGGV